MTVNDGSFYLKYCIIPFSLLFLLMEKTQESKTISSLISKK